MDVLLALIPVLLILLGIAAYSILSHQRCIQYVLYLCGLVSFFLAFEMVR